MTPRAKILGLVLLGCLLALVGMVVFQGRGGPNGAMSPGVSVAETPDPWRSGQTGSSGPPAVRVGLEPEHDKRLHAVIDGIDGDGDGVVSIAEGAAMADAFEERGDRSLALLRAVREAAGAGEPESAHEAMVVGALSNRLASRLQLDRVFDADGDGEVSGRERIARDLAAARLVEVELGAMVEGLTRDGGIDADDARAFRDESARFAERARLDFNGDGVVDTADHAAFIDLYLAGDPRADLDGDGSIGTHDAVRFRWLTGK